MSQPAIELTHPAESVPVRLTAIQTPPYLEKGRSLADVSTPVTSPKPMPVTRPTHRFDRASFASPEVRSPFDTAAEWQEHKTTLDDPLPEGIADPQHVAARLVIQSVEVLLGHRPARQLQTWMAPEVYAAIVRRAGLASRVDGRSAKTLPPRIRRVVLSRPRKRVAECSLVIFDGRKVRAAAIRLEVRRRNWHVMALDII